MDASNVFVFGKTPTGEPVYRVSLQNNKLSCEIITYGAILRTLHVPDRDDQSIDIVLGYDSLDQYLADEFYFGATVGRVANRIANGRFILNGQTYSLPLNNGSNHHHGGPEGFSRHVWKIEKVSASSVTMSLTSPDGDQGYPGTIKATAEYTIQDNSLIIRHTAVSDKDTLCSLTNHSYFNLSGHNSGNAMDQNILLFAHEYTPSDPEGIPTGEIASVEGTPMDLREMIPICSHLDDPAPALIKAKGYDHNYVLSEYTGSVRPAAIASSDITGITMHMATSMPGVHFYTSNYVSQGLIGKDEAIYGPRHAFCLEPQFFPDAIHHPAFPSPILRSGELYSHIIQLTFTTF